MRIDLPLCDLKTCRFCFDGNCTDVKINEECEYAEMMDKRIHGLFIELPVPIGSKVYGIDSKNEIYEFEISIHFPLGMLKTLMLVWGKEVFPTREEAEKRLEESKR